MTVSGEEKYGSFRQLAEVSFECVCEMMSAEDQSKFNQEIWGFTFTQEHLVSFCFCSLNCGIFFQCTHNTIFLMGKQPEKNNKNVFFTLSQRGRAKSPFSFSFCCFYRINFRLLMFHFKHLKKMGGLQDLGDGEEDFV